MEAAGSYETLLGVTSQNHNQSHGRTSCPITFSGTEFLFCAVNGNLMNVVSIRVTARRKLNFGLHRRGV
jgi:hypothetical protein